MTEASEHVPGLVTTVIPVHNRPVRLAEAVGSVLAQTYRPIEVVVVSDGSTDETESVGKGLEERHPGVVRVISRPNGGPGPARETGRLVARGEFIQYLDSDDLYLPEKTDASVSALRTDGGAGVAACDSVGVFPDGRSVPRIIHIDDAVFPGLLTTDFREA